VSVRRRAALQLIDVLPSAARALVENARDDLGPQVEGSERVEDVAATCDVLLVAGGFAVRC
jgi:hypothetical protein